MIEDKINRIFTFQVNIYGYAPNFKNYLTQEISHLDQTITAISVSYYNSYPSQQDMAFLTLIDKNNTPLLSNFPIVDLQDVTSKQGPAITIEQPRFRLRKFALNNISTSRSYVIYNETGGPASGNLLNINFYY